MQVNIMCKEFTTIDLAHSLTEAQKEQKEQKRKRSAKGKRAQKESISYTKVSYTKVIMCGVYFTQPSTISSIPPVSNKKNSLSNSSIVPLFHCSIVQHQCSASMFSINLAQASWNPQFFQPLFDHRHITLGQSYLSYHIISLAVQVRVTYRIEIGQYRISTSILALPFLFCLGTIISQSAPKIHKNPQTFDDHKLRAQRSDTIGARQEGTPNSNTFSHEASEKRAA